MTILHYTTHFLRRVFDRFRHGTGFTIREVRVPTLRDVWFLEKLPFDNLDAELVDNPPFADISGIRSIVLETARDIYNTGRVRILIVGERGSGKTTFVKSLLKLLRSFSTNIATIYISAKSCISYEDFMCNLYKILNQELANSEEYSTSTKCIMERADKTTFFTELEKVLRELILRKRCVVVAVDNFEKLVEYNYHGSIRLVKLLESYVLEYDNLSLIFTMNYSHYLKFSYDVEFNALFKDYRVINLKDFCIRSVDDVVRLVHAHLHIARPWSRLDIDVHKMQNVLAKNPIHPFTMDAISTLYNILGTRTPREYVLTLHDIIRQAAEIRVPKIDSTVIVKYFKVVPVQERVVKQSLTQGMFIGSFLGMGTFMLTFGILSHRLEAVAYGVIMLAFAMITYLTQKGKTQS